MEKNLFKELNERKNIGEKLEWDDITKEELEELFDENISDSMISELYGVSASKVTYKRKKWNINIKNSTQKKFFESELYKGLNLESKKRLLDKNNIETISIALTHYLFRNGPVEDMHSEGKLSQQDMKTLNKFMVNRIAGLLESIHEEDWLKLELVLNAYSIYGRSWDKPIPDKDEIEIIYKMMLNANEK